MATADFFQAIDKRRLLKSAAAPSAASILPDAGRAETSLPNNAVQFPALPPTLEILPQRRAK